MFHQVGHVFKENNLGSLGIDNTSNLKEKITSLIIKAFLPSGYRKRLTREACGKYIKIGYIICMNTADIRFYKIFTSEIVSVCSASGGIVFVSPNNIKTRLFEARTDATNTCN